jgi:hypothetical protein
MKNLIITIIVLFSISSLLTSCSSTQECWAYRDTQHYSKKNKRTPSKMAAKNYFSKKSRIAKYN